MSPCWPRQPHYPQKITFLYRIRMKEFEKGRVLVLGGAQSDVYTKNNFHCWCKHQDDAVAQRQAKGVRLPIFARDGPTYLDEKGVEKRGHKMYASFSWGQMLDMIRDTPPVLRNFYELVYYDSKANKGDPLNIFMDADLDLNDVVGEITDTRIDEVYEEIFTCVEHAIRDLVDAKVPGWHTAWTRDDFVVNSLVSDIPAKKISRHYVVHFPGHAMIKNIVHLKSFMALVMEEHYKRINFDKSNSCLYFFSKSDQTYRPIIDVSVYSKMRPFRMIGCVKRLMDPNACKWPLAPACTHEGSCEDAACFYRHQRKVHLTDFLANLITFVSPDSDGSPVDVPLLDVPFVMPPWLKNTNPCDDNKRGPRRAHIRADGSPVTKDTNLLLARTDINIDARAPLDELFGVRRQDQESENESASEPDKKRVKRAPVPTLAGLMTDISYAIETQTGDKCLVYEYRIRATGSVIIQSDSRVCPYASREHRSNHISYIVRINYPYPTIWIRCTDPNCESDLATDRVKRVYLEPDKALFASVKRDTLAYFNAQFITAKMLCLDSK